MIIKIDILILISLFIYSCSSNYNTELIPKCNNSCTNWQFCNEKNICEVKSNYCEDYNDCSSNEICNEDNHQCESKMIDCQDDCYEWEYCINNTCQLKTGFCYWDGDCGDNQYCNPENNKCLTISNSCSLECESWETCSINDDFIPKCETNHNLSWKRLILDEDSIKMPLGINGITYDSKNKIILNYFINTEENHIIGEINLISKKEYENDLLEEDFFPDSSIFCEDKKENCQFLHYNKETKDFIALSPYSLVLTYFNYNKITKKPRINGRLPLLSNKISTTFNENGDKFFVYNNRMSGNSLSQLYQFSIVDMSWKLLVENLPNVSNNCLVENKGILYSFGGLLSYNDERSKNYISKYYEIDYKNNKFKSFEMPDNLNKRANITCAYDSRRNLIFLYGGSKIVNEYNELNNSYYDDLWSFNPETKKWKLILNIDTSKNFLPPDEDGNRVFNGDVKIPSFGKNKSKMIYDEIDDKLILIGEIPPEKGFQIYTINLSK